MEINSVTEYGLTITRGPKPDDRIVPMAADEISALMQQIVEEHNYKRRRIIAMVRLGDVLFVTSTPADNLEEDAGQLIDLSS